MVNGQQFELVHVSRLLHRLGNAQFVRAVPRAKLLWLDLHVIERLGTRVFARRDIIAKSANAGKVGDELKSRAVPGEQHRAA